MRNREQTLPAYSAVVFDCADTLLFRDPPRPVVFQGAAAKLGINLSLEEIERAYEIVDFAVKMRSSQLKTDEAKLEFYKTINAMLCDVIGIREALTSLHPVLVSEFVRLKRWRPFLDAKAMLGELGGHTSLYVLANWDAGLKNVLQDCGLLGFFKDVWPSELLGSEKPSLACFQGFLSHTSLDARTALYVGNEYVADILGARSAGMTPILVDRTGRLPSADCLRVTSLSELGRLLSRADHA